MQAAATSLQVLHHGLSEGVVRVNLLVGRHYRPSLESARRPRQHRRTIFGFEVHQNTLRQQKSRQRPVHPRPSQSLAHPSSATSLHFVSRHVTACAAGEDCTTSAAQPTRELPLLSQECPSDPQEPADSRLRTAAEHLRHQHNASHV